MSSLYKSLIVTTIFFVFILLGYSYYDRQFRLSNIKYIWPNATVSQITEERLEYLNKIFSQPFHYLDRGKQSFVFESQDKKYVLKFFDNRCLRSGKFSFLISIKKNQCEKKLNRLLIGYQVAETHDVENTGLLFLQLVPDPAYRLKVNLTDRFSLSHVIDLSEVPFVLQEKAIPLRKVISGLLKKDNVVAAEKRLREIMDMYVNEYQRGVIDLDHNFMYNTGFVDGHPIRIDLGRLTYEDKIKDPILYRYDLEKVFIGRLGSWLDRHFPKYKEEIMRDMQNKLDLLNDFFSIMSFKLYMFTG